MTLIPTKGDGCKLVTPNTEWVLPFNRERWRLFQQAHPKEFGEIILECLEGMQDLVQKEHYQEGEDPNILKALQDFICDVECQPIWGELEPVVIFL